MADLHFDPVSEEVVRAFIDRRLPMKRALFDALPPELQGLALTVSGIECLDALHEILTLVSGGPARGGFCYHTKEGAGRAAGAHPAAARGGARALCGLHR